MCAGVLLSLVMLFASEDQLLGLYVLLVPMIISNVIVMKLVQSTVNASPPPPPPTTAWSRLMEYVPYFVGKDDRAAAGEVEEVLWLCNAVIPLIVTLLGLLSNAGFYLLTGSEVPTTVLLILSYFLHRTLQQLVEVSKSDVDLVPTLLWFLVLWEMKMWSVFCLERAIISSARAVHTLVVSVCPDDISSYPIVGTIYRAVKWLVMPNDRRSQMVVCIVNVAVTFALPSVAVLGLTAGKQHVYLPAHLIIAARLSVRSASMIIRDFIKRRYSPADVIGDVEYVNLVVKVSKQITAASSDTDTMPTSMSMFVSD